MSIENTDKIDDIPNQIFDVFLEKLKTDDQISSDTIDRLRTVLFANKTPTDAAIRSALFSDKEVL